MPRMIIFDDGRGQFGPMTDLRASFELRTGMLTTAGRIKQSRPKQLAGYWVPSHLRAAVADRADAPVNALADDDETLLCVNGRWSVPEDDLTPEVGHALIESETRDVIIAHLRRADAEFFLTSGELPERAQVKDHADRVLFRYPWDIIGLAWRTIPHDIFRTRMLEAGVPGANIDTMGDHPIEIHDSARIAPHVVLDASQGPIVIHERAAIRPGAVLCGPCSVGRDATVIDRAHIKSNTVIGPHCKVGGEVGATIFQGYSNKAHDGHLGDSWVGKWVNFGAGTTNSNLLNTYGEVAMRLEPDGPRRRSGLNFLGTIVGDHAKFAIGTRIMTGTVIGTGAMIATSVPPPTTVKRFAWLTDDGERVYRYDKFVEVVRAVMERRRKAPSEAYLTLLREVYERFTAGS
ncbi:MAG: hypothetical protein EA377_10250 [Phycisphaerales bacterium]|nr:MAG: hypothetical protein EA377_10250 [Phycisphaerales bacterium]